MKSKLQELINFNRKAQDHIALVAYQSVVSAIQEKENRQNLTLNEDQIIKVIKRERDMYLESAEAFEGRPEEADNKSKAKLLDKLLPNEPEPIDESEYDEIVNKVIVDSGAQTMGDMGNVMKQIKDDYGNSIDMKKISAIVKKKL